MRTRSSGPVVEPSSTPRRRRKQKRPQQQVNPTIVEEKPVVTMADTRTRAELLRAPTEENAEAIVVPPIPAEHFELKHSLLNLVTSKQFFRFEKEDPHAYIRWFNKIISTMKYKDVPETAIKLMLFPFSIDGPDWIWLEKEPPRSIETWDDLVSNSLNPSDQDSLNSAASGNLLEKNTQDALKIIENKSKVRTSRNKPVVAKVSTNTSTSGLSPDIAALTDAVKALLLKNTTPPPTFVKAVEESCVTCGGPHPYYHCPTTNANASGYQDNIQAYISAAAVNYNQGNAGYHPPSVAHQSRPPGFPAVQNNQNRGNNYTPGNSTYRALTPPIAPSNELANYMKVNETHIFSDALLYMPKFASTFKNLLSHKEKLFEVATNTPVNENCSAIILKKLPEKLGDPDKFLIPCNFPEIPECLALADLGASINLMPLFIWRKLSLPELNANQMILELADWSTTRPTGIAKDVFVRVGKFHFLADFVVVDYDVDPHVPLILRRLFLRTARALIDVYGEELTLRVGDEAITFKDSGNSERGNPTLASEPIIARSSPSLTPFEGGLPLFLSLRPLDLISKRRIPMFLFRSMNVSIQKEIFVYLNEDPSSPLPPKEIKTEELKSVKSSIDEPLELELKDLPSHLEYVFLEGTDKLLVIIAKYLKDDEKERLIKVLKSHKHAIAWKLSDIKGIDPQFCTYKILMEEDFKSAV
nr:reverse transcriptase domain-containing protein [Tanacetum cinerariifolium]